MIFYGEESIAPHVDIIAEVTITLLENKKTSS